MKLTRVLKALHTHYLRAGDLSAAEQILKLKLSTDGTEIVAMDGDEGGGDPPPPIPPSTEDGDKPDGGG